MKVIDAGHQYELDTLDDIEHRPIHLRFVKRKGDKYPGNVGKYHGTTMQEVLRALIERGEYVNHQAPCDETTQCIALWRQSLWLLEMRAARQHDRILSVTDNDLATGETKCVNCGHLGCSGECSR